MSQRNSYEVKIYHPDESNRVMDYRRAEDMTEFPDEDEIVEVEDKEYRVISRKVNRNGQKILCHISVERI